MVFYLKYRPQSLSELDNEAVAALISKYLAKEPIPHAFLFTGPKGTGKTSTARIVAKTVNCKNKKNGENCSTCPICQSIAKGTQLDVLEIDAASNRGIDEIRSLREKIKLVPLELTFKVYIIDEVHMLTTEAFNALLKTLEEPPSHALFILATTESHKVPETVLSRCVHIKFDKASSEEIIKSLSRIVKGEKLDIDKEALTEIAAASDGSFRDGAKILQELSLEERRIGLKEVQAKIGSIDSSVINVFVDILRRKNIKELLEMLMRFETDGKNIKQFFLSVLKHLEQELVKMYSGGKSNWNAVDLRDAITYFSDAFVQLKTSVIPTLPFELAIVGYAEKDKTVPSGKVQSVADYDVDSQSNEVNSTYDAGSCEPFVKKWDAIIEKIKPLNNLLSGVLRSCHPVHFENDTLLIEAAYKFHAERLNEEMMRNVLAKTIKDVVGSSVKIKTVLKKR